MRRGTIFGQYDLCFFTRIQARNVIFDDWTQHMLDVVLRVDIGARLDEVNVSLSSPRNSGRKHHTIPAESFPIIYPFLSRYISAKSVVYFSLTVAIATVCPGLID